MAVPMCINDRMPRKKAAKADTVVPAEALYKARLSSMSDGALERERMALRLKGPDSWEMNLWRAESSKRTPVWR